MAQKILAASKLYGKLTKQSLHHTLLYVVNEYHSNCVYSNESMQCFLFNGYFHVFLMRVLERNKTYATTGFLLAQT